MKRKVDGLSIREEFQIIGRYIQEHKHLHKPCVENFRPFKLTFELCAPINLSFPFIHLDAIVAHAALRNLLGDMYYVLPAKFPLKSDPQKGDSILPLQRNGTTGTYHASAAVFDAAAKRRVEVLYKKFEDRWIGGKRKIAKGMGHFKDYMMQIVYLPTRTVIFYGLGDIEAVLKISRELPGLGDNTRIGWGAIRKVSADELSLDCSLFMEGCAMRAIPVTRLKTWTETAHIAYKSPYWAPESVAECCVPGTEAAI